MERFQVLSYSKETLKETLKIALEYAAQQLDTRFTLLLPPEIVSYLEDLGKSGVNRSEFIRSLIKEKMQNKKNL